MAKVDVPDASTPSQQKAEQVDGSTASGFGFSDGGWDYSGKLGSGSGTGTNSAARGSLEPADVQRAVRARAPAISACYERELARDPKLSVKADARLVIAADGSVSLARLSPSTGVAALDECLTQTLYKLKFQPPGGSVTVSYPLSLQPSS